MKKSLLLYVSLLLSFNLVAQKTEIQYLSGTDKDHTVKWDFFCTKGMNSGKWSAIQVPSNWEFQGFGAFNYGQNEKVFNDEKGLYKYNFSIPKFWKKKSIFLVFEGSMTDTEVKINGKSAGAIHQGSFYRFKYNITELLNFGSKNLLEVTVSKESTDPTINKAERRGDFWVFGGIYRPVYLEATPSQSIDRVAIDAKADGSFKLDAFLIGIKKGKTIEARIQTNDGQVFGKPIIAEVPSAGEQIKLEGLFPKPLLWNPETPNLYDVVVSLKEGKKVLHQVRQRFGFRTVEVRTGDGIYVNDQKIIFRGVCRHTAWPTSGRCSSKELSILDVNLMKDMNMNAVRMSHYPPDQHFLEVCDSLGLFVLDELTGWQAYYGTEVGKRLVRELVERDVNHPSILLWDNGNEGGFNKELRGEYAKYDPQNRQVIEPWAKLNGTDTKHYPGYKYVDNALNSGNLIYFPTEFLHGLYDGGLGAGLDDYWNLMSSKPLAAGGFLWVFADEGIVRNDLKDSVDTHGNNAPDGILGPYREKEASYYTIKEIWSPVHVGDLKIDKGFSGNIPVTNRFLYTNLQQCKFTVELVRYTGIFSQPKEQKLQMSVTSPKIAVGESGSLKLALPDQWNEFDALALTATDPFGRQINRWSWPIAHPADFLSRIVKTSQDEVSGIEKEDYVLLSSGKTTAQFSRKTGLLTEVKVGDKNVPFNNGPHFTGDTLNFKGLTLNKSGKNQVVEVSFDQSPGCFARWTMLPGGWLELEYRFHPEGKVDYAGISFDYPDNLVKGATLVANGPYRVWKNRMKGTEFGIFSKKYNNTVTGETWDYPEFKGYYSNFYAVQVQTKELPFTIISATEGLFLQLYTPKPARFVKGGVAPPFPAGNISILNGISAIGTKFTKPEAEGPQSQKNEYLPGAEPLSGKLYFHFGE
ncbi:MAG: glycoside hydrolase family 2 TIM barrel-domain containing protein [Prolixibacteraceae bacterium]